MLTPEKILEIALERGMCTDNYANTPLDHCVKFADDILAAAASGAAPVAWIERRFANDEMVLETIKREPMSEAQRADLAKYYRVESIALVTAAALQQASMRADKSQRERDTLVSLLSQIVEGDVGRQTLGKLSAGQSTETDEGKAWLAVKALLAREKQKMEVQSQRAQPSRSNRKIGKYSKQQAVWKSK